MPSAIQLALVLIDGATVAVRLRRYEQAEAMRLAAQGLWPACPVTLTMNAIILYGAQRFEEALEVLDDSDSSIDLPVKTACLLMLENPSWQALARQIVLQNDDLEGMALARRLLEIYQVPEAAGQAESGPHEGAAFLYKGIKV